MKHIALYTMFLDGSLYKQGTLSLYFFNSTVDIVPRWSDVVQRIAKQRLISTTLLEQATSPKLSADEQIATILQVSVSCRQPIYLKLALHCSSTYHIMYFYDWFDVENGYEIGIG